MSPRKPPGPPVLASVPAFIRDLARSARFNLHEALQEIKHPEGPQLDDACEKIRKALEDLKPLAD